MSKRMYSDEDSSIEAPNLAPESASDSESVASESVVSDEELQNINLSGH